jgi:hypothetical protein
MPSPVPVYSLPQRYARLSLPLGPASSSLFASNFRHSDLENSTWKELPHAT